MNLTLILLLVSLAGGLTMILIFIIIFGFEFYFLIKGQDGCFFKRYGGIKSK